MIARKKKTIQTSVPRFGANHEVKTKKPESSGIVLRSKVWLEKDGELFMGWGRVTLLERIGELGSISAAARSMHLAYRNAWLWVEAMNRLAPQPLVVKSIGGTKGGYAVLTEAGQKIIREFKAARENVRKAAAP